MKINIYKTQKEVEKTYSVDNYDLMYGTIQDILAVMDEGLPDLKDEEGLFALLAANRKKIDELLLDIFSSEGMTEEELRRTKIKEMVPLFIDLFSYVKNSFESKN